MEEAGLTPRVKYGWTKERLKRQFLKLLRQGKILPLRESFNHCEQLPSTGVTRNLFGSFRAFLPNRGIEANSSNNPLAISGSTAASRSPGVSVETSSYSHWIRTSRAARTLSCRNAS